MIALHKKNGRFLIVLVLSIAMTLVLFDYLILFLIGVGGKINYWENYFVIGYFLLISVLVFTYCVLLFRTFIHNNRITFVVVYTTIIYCILRFFSVDNIQFIPLDTSLKYGDIILLIFLFQLLGLTLVYRREGMIRNEKSKTVSFFIEDSLFDNGEIDNEKILKKLVQSLKGFKPQIAFTCGLNAVWGYGKSSFLKRFEIQYKKESPKSIVFWYHIWKNKGANAIIDQF